MDEKSILLFLKLKSFLETQMELKRRELESLASFYGDIKRIIEETSFRTADTLISHDNIDVKSEFKISKEPEDKNKEIMSDSEFVRRISAKSNPNEILMLLKYKKGTIEVDIPNPMDVDLTQERYIKDIVLPVLQPLKKDYPKIVVRLKKYKTPTKSYIKNITLENIEDFGIFERIYRDLNQLIMADELS